MQTKEGDTASRLLKEAVLLRDGASGLIEIADKNCDVHPGLYLSAMEEFNKFPFTSDKGNGSGNRAFR